MTLIDLGLLCLFPVIFILAKAFDRYAHPQPRTWVDLTGEELETLLRENRSLTLGAIWAVADKLKEKNNG